MVVVVVEVEVEVVFVLSKQTFECRFFSLEIVDPGAYRIFFLSLYIIIQM